MAEKVLRSELIITAKDKTGAVFDKVGAQFDRLALAGKRVDGVGRNFLNVATAIDKTGREVDKLEGRIKRLDRLFGRSAGGGPGAFAFTKGLGFGLAQMSAYTAAAALAEKTVRATVVGQHERVRMEAAGMTPGEIAEAEATAAELSARFKPLSQTTILHALRNARSIVGTYEEAAKVLEPMMRLRVIAQGAHPERSEELEEDFDQIIKGMEIKGVTQDLPKFTHYMDNMAKALNVFGDTLRPADYYAMFKYGRAATQSLSDEFMLETAPTFAQEMTGAGAGTGIAAAYATIVGGQLKAVAANELLKLGLIGDKSKLKISKAGIVTQVRPGAVLGTDLYAKNPLSWVNQLLLPALAKKGITDKDKIVGEIATIFRNQRGAQFIDILATQQSRIEKDRLMIRGAKGLEAAETFMNKDVGMAWQGLEEQVTNLMQVAGSPLAIPAAHNLNVFADAIAAFTGVLREGPPKNANTFQLGSWAGDLLGKGASMLRYPLSLLSIPTAAGVFAGDVGKWAGHQLWGIEWPGFDAATPSARGGSSHHPLSSDDAFGAPASPEAKLTGDANLHVKISVDQDGLMHVESSVDGSIPGVKIGTTGSVGKAWDDLTPGQYP